MTRIFALLLMSLTAAALARFLAPATPATDLPILTLGLPLLAIGTLFGLLAIDWHLAWSIPTALIAGVMLYLGLGGGSPAGGGADAPGVRPIRWTALAIPPVALLGGSLLGSLAMRRKHRVLSEPEAGD